MGYRSHLREPKLSKISWGGMPPDPPTMHWHALHAANLSKPLPPPPPHSAKVVYAHAGTYFILHINMTCHYTQGRIQEE